MQQDIATLLGLIAVAVIAVGAVILLLRVNGQAANKRNGFVLGYPPSRFPDRNLTSQGPLAALALTQTRLLSLYEQLPPQSSTAVWIHAFLTELRGTMDTAYRVAAITRAYGSTTKLDPLVAEVQQIETRLADQVVNQLMNRDDNAGGWEQLNGRLAVMRRYVNELGNAQGL